jgi:rhodanese-related sulfurtransferase
MASTLLLRAGAIVVGGIIAGAVHSAMKPVMLRPETPAPLTVPARPVDNGKVAETGAPVPPNPALPQAPITSAPPAPPPPSAPRPDEMAGLNISLAQAKSLYDARVPFIDARHMDEYEAGHVQDAFQMSTEDFNGSDVLNYLDRNAPIVVYCSGGQCDASKNLVKLLQQAGYKQARIMEDGYPAWSNAGYPTAAGKPAVGGGG